MKFDEQTKKLVQMLSSNSDVELIQMIRAITLFLSEDGKKELLSTLRRLNIKPEVNVHNGFFTEKVCYFCSARTECMRVTSIDEWICYHCNKLAVKNFAKEECK